jgi:hypothetical protein
VFRIGTFLAALACILLAHCGSSSTIVESTVAELDRTWFVHYQPDIDPIGEEAYVDLLRQLPTGHGLSVVVSNPAHGERFRAALGNDARIRIVQAAAPVTPWARDRYLLFRRGARNYCVAKPWYDLPENLRGDARVPTAIGHTSDVVVVHSPIAPVGGDVIITDDHVLIGETSVAEAMARSRLPLREVLREYEELFGRTPAVVPSGALGIARIHIDLFVAWASDRRVVVSDTRPADEMWGRTGSFRDVRFGTFRGGRNRRIQRGLDEVAASMAALGYEVHRVPGLVSEPHGVHGNPTVISYTNTVIEGSQAFVPTYGLGQLDEMAQAVWSELGFQCAPIRCERAVRGGGAIRCLTNRLQ